MLPGSPLQRALFGGVALMGAVAPRTYPDFVDHITGLATAGSLGFNSNVVSTSAAKYRTTVVNAFSGIMNGTSWSDRFLQGANVSRVITHAFPSLAKLQEAVTNTRQVYFEHPNADVAFVFTGLNRNGFSSTSYSDGEGYIALKITRLIRWDDTLSKAFQSDPSVGGSETEYVF